MCRIYTQRCIRDSPIPTPRSLLLRQNARSLSRRGMRKNLFSGSLLRIVLVIFTASNSSSPYQYTDNWTGQPRQQHQQAAAGRDTEIGVDNTKTTIATTTSRKHHQKCTTLNTRGVSFLFVMVSLPLLVDRFPVGRYYHTDNTEYATCRYFDDTRPFSAHFEM